MRRRPGGRSTKYDLMRLAETAALLVVAIMLIMLVARPMIARLLPAWRRPALPAAGAAQAALPSGAGRPALAPPQAEGQPAGAGDGRRSRGGSAAT